MVRKELICCGRLIKEHRVPKNFMVLPIYKKEGEAKHDDYISSRAILFNRTEYGRQIIYLPQNCIRLTHNLLRIRIRRPTCNLEKTEIRQCIYNKNCNSKEDEHSRNLLIILLFLTSSCLLAELLLVMHWTKPFSVYTDVYKRQLPYYLNCHRLIRVFRPCLSVFA